MASQGDLQLYFSLMREKGFAIVEETPKLDLDQYIQNYTGRTRYDRLMLIGRSSVAHCVDALKAAVVEAKKGRDVKRYQDACEHLRKVAPNDPDAQTDQGWVDNTSRHNQSEINRLTTELNGYKNNLIKDSIRMGQQDLGKHLECVGDLDAALDMFIKMRSEVTSPRHLAEISKHMVNVHIEKREFSHAAGAVQKMSGNVSGDDEKTFAPFIRVVAGIAMMGTGNYEGAARQFLLVDSSLQSSCSDIISPNDVAIYGGLLSLATMERGELKSRVLEDQKFRHFLELEPHIRRAINMFVNGRYSSCLATLESYRADYLLDIYLQPHIMTLYSMIRRKCIIQYMIPFSCVTFDSMDSQLSINGNSLEEDLVTMIRSGDLKARINTVDKVITAIKINPRVQMQIDGAAGAKAYHQEALERIRRISIASADLEVRGMKKGSIGLQAFQDVGAKFGSSEGLQAGDLM